jgi:hypothetical protein
MSQSIEKADLNIEVFITLDDQKEPQAITVNGYGSIPRSALRAIADEALDGHFGSVHHGFRCHLSPVVEEDESTVFEVYKRTTPAKR